MSAATVERIFRKFGTDVKFDTYESFIDVDDLASAIQLGHVVSLTYHSNKEGEWIEYEHDFPSSPALFEIGIEEGEPIEALLDVDEEDLKDVAFLADFLEMTYVSNLGDMRTIEGDGSLYFEPHTNTLLIELDDDSAKFAIVGFRVGRWLYG